MQPTDNQRLLAYLNVDQADMVAHLVRLAEMESPTDDKAAIDRLGATLAASCATWACP